MRRLLFSLLVLAMPSVTGCGGDDPVAPIDGGPMEFRIRINPSDIDAGMIDRDVSINTAAVGLWTSYLRLVTDLCGREPAGFTVRAPGISMDLEESLGVTSLEQVLDDTVTLYFTSGGVAVDVAAGVVSGAGPVALGVTSTRETLAPLHSRMLASDFHVGIRSETSHTGGEDFSMELELSFLVRASCE